MHKNYSLYQKTSKPRESLFSFCFTSRQRPDGREEMGVFPFKVHHCQSWNGWRVIATAEQYKSISSPFLHPPLSDSGSSSAELPMRYCSTKLKQDLGMGTSTGKYVGLDWWSTKFCDCFTHLATLIIFGLYFSILLSRTFIVLPVPTISLQNMKNRISKNQRKAEKRKSG